MAHAPGLTESNQAWLDDFRARHGRNPRVLHIGNIANNAYLNAGILRRCGIDCDVLCFDYYHIMANPEWESSPLEGDHVDDFFPRWNEVNLHGFKRPRWFAHGPLEACLRYLRARRRGTSVEAERTWNELADARQRACNQNRDRQSLGDAKQTLGQRSAAFLRCLARKALRVCRPHANVASSEKHFDLAGRIDVVLDEYRARFPETDLASASDVSAFIGLADLWSAVLACYDLVVGYATDGLFPLILGRTPYIAYEHGTIRSIPFEPTPLGRNCALSYRLADKVFITNCDNRLAAERLGLDDYGFVPHPVNEERHPTIDARALRASLRQRLSADFVLFHPARQHWEACRHPSWEKGNDILIHGFARFLREVCPSAGAVFVNWGKTVAASRALLQELGIAERVLWIPPQPNQHMIAYIEATDLLADQFYLGAFGSTMPKALMLGRPALLYLDEAVHGWCFPELPPVLNARTPEQVCEQLTRVWQNESYRNELSQRGREWYHRHHDNGLIANRFVEAISDLLRRGRRAPILDSETGRGRNREAVQLVS